MVVDPGGGGGCCLEDGVLLGLGGVGWEVEGVVGVGDHMEGVEVRGARGRGRACGAVRTGWRGALGSIMALGPRLRGDDVVGVGLESGWCGFWGCDGCRGLRGGGWGGVGWS